MQDQPAALTIPNQRIASEYLNADELLQLPPFSHVKSATLAKWRQSGKGPKLVTIGGRPFYVDEVFAIEIERAASVKESSGDLNVSIPRAVESEIQLSSRRIN